jgi:hypothetical protein
LLPRELVDFVESGVSMALGTVGEGLVPECVRVCGASVAPDRARLTLLVGDAIAGRTRANIEAGSRVAVTFSRIYDHRTVQVKGRAIAVRAGTEADHAIATRYVSAFAEALHPTGLGRAYVRRLRIWPLVAIDVEVDALYQQTPGPGAGEALRP